MSIKNIDPDDSYIVRRMFGCGHGHVMPPRFTHWESGEACPLGHEIPTAKERVRYNCAPGPKDNESYHLYGRLVLVPIVTGKGQDMWTMICSDPNKFCHLPLAPKGLQEGQRIGTKLKLLRGEELRANVDGEIVYYDLLVFDDAAG